MRLEPAAYREALVVHRPAAQALFALAFADNDVEVLLAAHDGAARGPPAPAGRGHDGGRRGRDPAAVAPTYLRNTDPASGAGLPALSVPAGLTGDDVPVGMELVGPAGTDDVVLAIGEALEAARGPLPGPAL